VLDFFLKRPMRRKAASSKMNYGGPTGALNTLDRVLHLTPAAVLFCCALLAITASFKNSITVDESVILPRGLWIYRYGDFHLDSETAPLPSLLTALPVALIESPRFSQRPNPELTVWSVGRQFMLDNKGQYTRYYALARMVSIVALLGACLATWAFARLLYGPAGALLALVVVSFTPDLLAHGTLVTADVFLAAGFIGSLWAFDAFVRKQGWLQASILGIAIGLTALCKFTGILLLIFLPVSLFFMLLLKRFKLGADDDALRISPMFAIWGVLALVVTVVVINIGYANFPTSFKSIGEYTFAAPILSHVQKMLPAWLPAPLPYDFVNGVDQQLSEPPYDAYLLGTFNETGFWNYFIIGLLVKTPEPVILLALAAILICPRIGMREVPAIMVGLGSLGFVSFVSHKNIGMRYVLFLLPLAALLIGRIAAAPIWTARPAIAQRSVIVGCIWLALAAVSTWPHYLAYFNTVSGGPDSGHTYLLDSNIDWGQDLITLRDYMQRKGIGEIDLAYFGRVDPNLIYGIRFRPLWDRVENRYVVISANFLWGRGYWIYGTPYWMTNRNLFGNFRSLQPAAVLGHSLYVYDLGSR
jgi:dolichyl-phosphate-mannose-protein mannosyltransferase